MVKSRQVDADVVGEHDDAIAEAALQVAGQPIRARTLADGHALNDVERRCTGARVGQQTNGCSNQGLGDWLHWVVPL